MSGASYHGIGMRSPFASRLQFVFRFIHEDQSDRAARPTGSPIWIIARVPILAYDEFRHAQWVFDQAKIMELAEHLTKLIWDGNHHIRRCDNHRYREVMRNVESDGII